MLDITNNKNTLLNLVKWAKRAHLSIIFTYLVTLAAIISGVATYFSIAQSPSPFGPNPDMVLGLFLADLVLLLLLAVIILRRAMKLWAARKKSLTGSRLQTRIILLFSLVAVVPTIIVAVFSALFFNFGIQSWFDDKVSTALSESINVAEAYRDEHNKLIIADARAMASDLDRSYLMSMNDKPLFNKLVTTQQTIRSLTEAVVFQYHDNAATPQLKYRILAQGRLSFSLAFDLPSEDEIDRVSNGEEVLLYNPNYNRVRVLIKLNSTENTYLMVGRFVDSNIIRYMENTQGAVREYQALKAKISELQIKFSVIFIMVSLLLLLAAIWLGMIFASFFAVPIGKLIRATALVKGGNLSARVQLEGPENDELVIMGNAFNDMTAQLQRQRSALISANQQIDSRRRFSEAVLAGVSSGVIALNDEYNIILSNRSAHSLLDMSNKLLKGSFIKLFPSLLGLIQKAEKQTDKLTQEQVTLELAQKRLTLLVCITVEINHKKEIEGYIVTFDDISELVSAQRRAAWSDVARRIAHEIKNPLTPIQLAAERIQSKYRKEISNSPETFDRYTETIIRHVKDIGGIVEEFVNFARMPSPTFRNTDICELVKKVIFSQECVNEHIKYIVNIPSKPMIISCDDGQISQVISNLCKNAAEALKSKDTKNEQAIIAIHINTENNNCIIKIKDNGNGFPPDILDRATEPYVTTRDKGTGLGLAIVKKILEDHGAELLISNNLDHGACITISMPYITQ